MAKEKRQRANGAEQQRVTNLLLEMEPELRLLHGSLQILRALGETADSVEPIALAALAHHCDTAFQDVDRLWRACLVET